jgi:dihydrolipoamide dehydrogenase
MAYKTKPKKPLEIDFDLIVIGTGAGGGVAAHIAAAKHKKVAVVEQEKLGGECPNFGCVPTKAILQAAETYKTVQTAAEFGIKVAGVSVDFPAIKKWKDKAVKNTGTDEGKAAYEADGITVLEGHAHFLDPWTVNIKGKRYTAHTFLIATGTHDFIPPITGLKEVGYIGYRQALELTALPKKLCVIGGGAIGSEFTHYFATFGTEVHVMEFAPRLIAREDEEMSELLQALFEEKGVLVHTEAKVVKVEKKASQKVVSFEQHGKIHKILVDEILLASGKVPNTDLGLENAHVDYDPRHGIEVDHYLQTSMPHIYAAGDVTGGYMFTHVASYQSRIAAQNMFSQLKHAADYRAVPRCIFVAPEFAAVGATEAELKAKGKKYQVAVVPTSVIGRANTSQEDTGFVKIIADKKGRVLGASIVAPRAGEMIQELVLAVQWRMKASKIDYTMHAFPTWTQAVRLCASKIVCR